MKRKGRKFDDPSLFYKESKDDQNTILKWIDENLKGGRPFYRSSYELKHIFTDDTGLYITNGTMKEALRLSGLKIKDDTEINSWLVLVNKKAIIDYYK